MNPGIEQKKIHDFMIPRGYTVSRETEEETVFQRTHKRGYRVTVVYYHVPGNKDKNGFHAVVAIKMMSGTYEISMSVLGEEKFMEVFDQYEKSIKHAIHQISYEVEDTKKITEFSSIDG